MPDNFAAALSTEMRRALKQEINTLSDAAMAHFRRNDPSSYGDFMDLVNDLLTFENEHGAKIYEDAIDEHCIVTPRNSLRETIHDVRYSGRPISTMFDSMKEASADALAKTARNVRIAPTATTFSFESPAEFEHRPETEYRFNGTFSRDLEWRRFYKPGRWSTDWENAPTPDHSPKISPISSAETTPRAKDFMATLDTRWNIATVNAKKNRREGVTEPMDDHDETLLRTQDDAEHAAAKKAGRIVRERSKTFMDFIDSLPDPVEENYNNEQLRSSLIPAPNWSSDALDDGSALASEDTEQHSSKASLKSSRTSQDEEGDSNPTSKGHKPNINHTSHKYFLDLQDDLADGLGELDPDAVHAKILVVDAPPRTLRRITAKISPR